MERWRHTDGAVAANATNEAVVANAMIAEEVVTANTMIADGVAMANEQVE